MADIRVVVDILQSNQTDPIPAVMAVDGRMLAVNSRPQVGQEITEDGDRQANEAGSMMAINSKCRLLQYVFDQVTVDGKDRQAAIDAMAEQVTREERSAAIIMMLSDDCLRLPGGLQPQGSMAEATGIDLELIIGKMMGLGKVWMSATAVGFNKAIDLLGRDNNIVVCEDQAATTLFEKMTHRAVTIPSGLQPIIE